MVFYRQEKAIVPAEFICWERLLSSLSLFTDDFMHERNQPAQQAREYSPSTNLLTKNPLKEIKVDNC